MNGRWAALDGNLCEGTSASCMAQLAEVPFLPGHRLLLSMGGLTKIGAEWVSVRGGAVERGCPMVRRAEVFSGVRLFSEKKKWVWSGRPLDHTLRQEEWRISLKLCACSLRYHPSLAWDAAHSLHCGFPLGDVHAGYMQWHIGGNCAGGCGFSVLASRAAQALSTMKSGRGSPTSNPGTDETSPALTL